MAIIELLKPRNHPKTIHDEVDYDPYAFLHEKESGKTEVDVHADLSPAVKQMGVCHID